MDAHVHQERVGKIEMPVAGAVEGAAAKVDRDAPEGAIAPGGHQLGREERLGEVAIVLRDHEEEPFPPRQGGQLRRLLGRADEGLLAEHVLAGLEGCAHDRGVPRQRGRHEHRVAGRLPQGLIEAAEMKRTGCQARLGLGQHDGVEVDPCGEADLGHGRDGLAPPILPVETHPDLNQLKGHLGLLGRGGRSCGRASAPARARSGRRSHESLWSGRRDSNTRHPAPKAGALPG